MLCLFFTWAKSSGQVSWDARPSVRPGKTQRQTRPSSHLCQLTEHNHVELANKPPLAPMLNQEYETNRPTMVLRQLPPWATGGAVLTTLIASGLTVWRACDSSTPHLPALRAPRQSRATPVCRYGLLRGKSRRSAAGTRQFLPAHDSKPGRRRKRGNFVPGEQSHLPLSETLCAASCAFGVSPMVCCAPLHPSPISCHVSHLETWSRETWT
jgi:hypothetical protein